MKFCSICCEIKIDGSFPSGQLITENRVCKDCYRMPTLSLILKITPFDNQDKQFSEHHLWLKIKQLFKHNKEMAVTNAITIAANFEYDLNIGNKLLDKSVKEFKRKINLRKPKLSRSLNDYEQQVLKHTHNFKVRKFSKKASTKIKVAQRMKNRRNTDPIFKLSSTIRSRTSSAIKNQGFGKKSQTLSQYLGCSLVEARLYLESLWQPGMNWENMGRIDNPNAWQIDHIVPLALAKNEAKLMKLSHYTNLQPLWTSEHVVKTVQDRKTIAKSKKQKSKYKNIDDIKKL